MSQFDDLLKLKGTGSPIDGLTPGSVVDLHGIPPRGDEPLAAYVAFIEDIGSGVLTGDVMAIYNGLLKPAEVLDTPSTELANILLFGDDMAGTAFGFDLPNWNVVEVTAAGEVIPPTPSTFPEFIRCKVASLASV